MRGRTNTDLYSGVSINGFLDQYEVATGETIIAGDFVERFTKIEGGIAASNDPIFQLSDGKYIVGQSIFDDNGDHTFTRYGSTSINKKPYFKIGTDEFVSFELRVSSQTGYVTTNLIKYDSTNKYCLTRSISYRFDSSWGWEDSSIYAIQISEKVFVIFVSYIGKNTNTSKYGNCWHIVKFTLSGTDYSDYTQSQNVIYTETSFSSSSKPDHLCVGWAVEIQANDYLVGVYKYSNTDYTYYNGSLYTMIRIKGASSATLKYISSSANMRPVGTVTSDGYIAFIEAGGGKLYQRYLYVDKNNIDTYNLYDSVFIKDLPDYTGASYKYTPLKVDNNVNGYDRYIIVQLASSIYLQTAEVYVSQSSQEITIGEFSDIATYQTSPYWLTMDFSFIHKRGTEDYLMIADSKIIETTVDNHIVEGEVDTKNYVRDIHSQAYIMGVANQSGTAGDTIEVYVPLVNT